jgi:hypothetical protein
MNRIHIPYATTAPVGLTAFLGQRQAAAGSFYSPTSFLFVSPFGVLLHQCVTFITTETKFHVNYDKPSDWNTPPTGIAQGFRILSGINSKVRNGGEQLKNWKPRFGVSVTGVYANTTYVSAIPYLHPNYVSGGPSDYKITVSEIGGADAIGFDALFELADSFIVGETHEYVVHDGGSNTLTATISLTERSPLRVVINHEVRHRSNAFPLRGWHCAFQMVIERFDVGEAVTISFPGMNVATLYDKFGVATVYPNQWYLITTNQRAFSRQASVKQAKWVNPVIQAEFKHIFATTMRYYLPGLFVTDAKVLEKVSLDVSRNVETVAEASEVLGPLQLVRDFLRGFNAQLSFLDVFLYMIFYASSGVVAYLFGVQPTIKSAIDFIVGKNYKVYGETGISFTSLQNGEISTLPFDSLKRAIWGGDLSRVVKYSLLIRSECEIPMNLEQAATWLEAALREADQRGITPTPVVAWQLFGFSWALDFELKMAERIKYMETYYRHLLNPGLLFGRSVRVSVTLDNGLVYTIYRRAPLSSDLLPAVPESWISGSGIWWPVVIPLIAAYALLGVVKPALTFREKLAKSRHKRKEIWRFLNQVAKAPKI